MGDFSSDSLFTNQSLYQSDCSKFLPGVPGEGSWASPGCRAIPCFSFPGTGPVANRSCSTRGGGQVFYMKTENKNNNLYNNCDVLIIFIARLTEKYHKLQQKADELIYLHNYFYLNLVNFSILEATQIVLCARWARNSSGLTPQTLILASFERQDSHDSNDTTIDSEGVDGAECSLFWNPCEIRYLEFVILMSFKWVNTGSLKKFVKKKLSSTSQNSHCEPKLTINPHFWRKCFASNHP